MEQCIKQRIPFPKKIANAPELEFGLEFYYFAFKDLNTCRNSGFALGPIPWTAINQYAISHGLSFTEMENLFTVINLLDEDFLRWQSTKA